MEEQQLSTVTIGNSRSSPRGQERFDGTFEICVLARENLSRAVHLRGRSSCLSRRLGGFPDGFSSAMAQLMSRGSVAATMLPLTPGRRARAPPKRPKSGEACLRLFRVAVRHPAQGRDRPALADRGPRHVSLLNPAWGAALPVAWVLGTTIIQRSHSPTCMAVLPS